MTNREKDSIDSDFAFDNTSKKISRTASIKNQTGVSFLLTKLVEKDNFLLVCRAVFHAEHEISIGACLVLGRKRDRRALPYLLRALLTTDRQRAEAVVWALGEIGDDSSIPFLLSALHANFVAKSAILALGKIGSPKAADAILGRLADNDETVRVLAAKALGQIRFVNDIKLNSRTILALKARIPHETSRRVKLLLVLICSRLEKTVE